ncbi:MAG: 1,4-beta-xylanase [Clostridiales bacterium]|nr:1,4-beta-xylanase [Clostridiales bacterium]
MSAYLFVHFREKITPDGEQVHFALSRDGFQWESVNHGLPVLWTYYGSRGARDFTICRCKATGKFCIIATDLSLAYGMRNEFHHSWEEISRHGSRQLSIWESDDLVNWSEQRLLSIGLEQFGCMWAPDVIYDRASDDYVLHWSSSHCADDYRRKAIYYSRTKDFVSFTAPQLLYQKADSGVIDSAMYEENGQYYLFVKSEGNPEKIILLRSDSAAGPFERVHAFDESMAVCQSGLYEAPTAIRLDDGRWCLFIDYYGVRGKGQGYVPFVADSLSSGQFRRYDAARADGKADQEAAFSFPYGFKHGTILAITQEEYDRIRNHDWQGDQFEVNP